MIMRHLAPYRARRNRALSWDPFNLWDAVFEDVNHEVGENADFVPRLDVIDEAKQIRIETELPGVDEKNIDVSLDHDLLTIKGEKIQEKKTDEDNYHRVERSYGSFQRQVRLPADAIDDAEINAAFKNGVLSITIPKKEAAQTTKKIDVKAE